jgi:sporulation protein YlmC with PRC-barrel domain
MLLPGSQLNGTPVLGLQTGVRLAELSDPIIDPATLHIVAYALKGPLLTEQPSFMLTNDVRELSSIGIIVDSSDEFIGLDDVIQVQKLHELGFNIIGMSVVDETKHKLGKIEDYSVDSNSFVIQQLNVRHGILRAFTDTGLLIHRSQIVAINDRTITVRTTAKKLEPVMQSERRTYVNPFRSASPQPENSDI